MQPHQDDADADNVAAYRSKKTRRPIVPMTATEAIALVFVVLGLLILLADYSGLFLIAIGIIGYVYGRITYRHPSDRYALHSTRTFKRKTRTTPADPTLRAFIASGSAVSRWPGSTK